VAKSDSPRVIDGLSSVRAAQRSGKTKGLRTRPSRTRLPKTEKGPPRKTDAPGASRIGHTVVPESHEIVCYKCGYGFTLRGRIEKALCPKCRSWLEVGDHVVDAECRGMIRTIGTIRILDGGVVNGGDLVATDVILAGSVKSGSVRASRRLELCPGAAFELGNLSMRDLTVRSGARFVINRRIACRDLEVEGEFKGKVRAENLIRVRPGGFLRGDIQTPRLVVEEGGGLKAKLNVGASAAPEPAAKKKASGRKRRHGS